MRPALSRENNTMAHNQNEPEENKQHVNEQSAAGASDNGAASRSTSTTTLEFLRRSRAGLAGGQSCAATEPQRSHTHLGTGSVERKQTIQKRGVFCGRRTDSTRTLRCPMAMVAWAFSLANWMIHKLWVVSTSIPALRPTVRSKTGREMSLIVSAAIQNYRQATPDSKVSLPVSSDPISPSYGIGWGGTHGPRCSSAAVTNTHRR